MTEKEQKEAMERELQVRVTVLTRVLMDTVSTLCAVADPMGLQYNRETYILMLQQFIGAVNKDGNRKEIIVPMSVKN